MQDGGYRHLPVVDDGRVVGVIDLRHGHAAHGKPEAEEVVPASTGAQRTVTGAIEIAGPKEPTQPVDSQP